MEFLVTHKCVKVNQVKLRRKVMYQFAKIAIVIKLLIKTSASKWEHEQR